MEFLKQLDEALLESPNAKITARLIRVGADVNYRTKYGDTALIRANPEQTKLLVEAAGVEAREYVNNHNDLGRTALMNAETAEQTKFLIDFGADVNATDMYENTALNYAKTIEQKKLLLDAGAKELI